MYFFFLFSILLIFQSKTTIGSCIWYGICEQTDQFTYYCAYNGTAKPLNDTSYETLTHLCPNLAATRDSPVCCNDDMLMFFSLSMKQANTLLRRCPSCFANFRMLFCSMTCGPNQADYMNANIVQNYVKSVTYSITDYVADSLYNSCKDVSFNTGRALDALCGSNECTRNLLFESLGKPILKGGHSPFEINFQIMPTSTGVTVSQKPMNMKFFSCNQSVPRRGNDPGGAACACGDCPSACYNPPINPPAPNESHNFLSINVWIFGSVVVFIFFTTVFLTFIITKYLFYKLHYKCDMCTQHTKYHEIKQKEMQLTQHVNLLTQIGDRLNEFLNIFFSKLGYKIARHPILCLCVSGLVVVLLACGLALMQVTTNPVDLWSGRYSRSRLEKDYFDTQFVPFYRTEQIIIRPRNQSNFSHPASGGASGDVVYGAALDKEFLLQVYALQQAVLNITVDYHLTENETIPTKINDLCFQPLYPTNNQCAVMSPFEYFQNNLTLFNYVVTDDWGYFQYDYLDHLLFCANSPLSVSGSPLDAQAGCLTSSGIPIQPGLALGAFNVTHYNGSQAVVLTFLVNNDPDHNSFHIRRSELWESAYIDLVRQWQSNQPNMIIHFQAERSVQDEIERQSQSDISTVAISYIVMFIYVSLFLGSYRDWRSIPVDVRFTLGLGGVLIVLASVVASIGFWSYLRLPITLIIIEVIPFLVLAVGVDNIFILVHAFELEKFTYTKKGKVKCQNGVKSTMQLLTDTSPTDIRDEFPHLIQGTGNESLHNLIELQVAKCVGRVGPSILMTTLAESVAFFCGALTSMPAVKVFALYAGMAIVFNFLLQIFAFIALLTLDARRIACQRFDILCCLSANNSNQGDESQGPVSDTTIRANIHTDTDDGNQHHLSISFESNANSQEEIYEIDLTSDHSLARSTHVNNEANQQQSVNLLHRLISEWFTPFVLNRWTRPIILIASLAWICYAVAILPNGLHIGMDQRLAMPEDSYVLGYFNAIADDLRVGPPVYFVVTEGHNYSGEAGQNQICGGLGCSEQSLVGQINRAFTASQYSWIATRANSWLDDYFDWIDPQGAPSCCRVHRNTTMFCFANDPDQSDCIPCPVNLNDGRPNSDDFITYLPFFLAENPNSDCPKAGRAAYSHAVKLLPNFTVGATYFMTYHSVLKNPDDFLNAMIAARKLAANITSTWRLQHTKHKSVNNAQMALEKNIVYPYGVFYIFYEQYLTLVNEAIFQFSICILAIALVVFILMGLNFLATVAVILGVLYIVISVSAIMVLWSISLNALSLVNLVVTLGISVEFCAHIVHSCAVSPKFTRLERATDALSNMGSSLLRGITLTKLGGIVVLATSKSRLFQIFYFRMYLTMIIFGAITGLIVMPVFLSYLGPSVNLATARKYHLPKLTSDNQQHDNLNFDH